MATIVLPEITRALYPFKSHFLALSDGKQMHYVDEGPEDGEPLVFVHGYPTWSFMYRAALVYYAARGFRCLAMDHIGYGLSDKPPNRHYHTVQRHIANLAEFFAALNLKNVTLVMEDWGGPFALGYAVQNPSNVRRLVIMNSWVFQDTYPPRLSPLIRLGIRPGLGELLLGTLNLTLSIWLQRTTMRRLSEAVMASYRAPFREARSRAALIQFPRMISTTPVHPCAPQLRAIEQALPALHSAPALILWGKEDPIFLPGLAEHWQKMLARARGPVLIEGAGHFLLEDAPEAVIEQLDRFLEYAS
jgi:haloalkane dehalogenase